MLTGQPARGPGAHRRAAAGEHGGVGGPAGDCAAGCRVSGGAAAGDPPPGLRRGRGRDAVCPGVRGASSGITAIIQAPAGLRPCPCLWTTASGSWNATSISRYPPHPFPKARAGCGGFCGRRWHRRDRHPHPADRPGVRRPLLAPEPPGEVPRTGRCRVPWPAGWWAMRWAGPPAAAPGRATATSSAAMSSRPPQPSACHRLARTPPLHRCWAAVRLRPRES